MDDLYWFIKSKAAEKHMNILELTDKYNEVYNKSITRQSLTKKLKDKTIKYTEYVMIMKLLGYDVVAIQRKA